MFKSEDGIIEMTPEEYKLYKKSFYMQGYVNGYTEAYLEEEKKSKRGIWSKIKQGV